MYSAHDGDQASASYQRHCPTPYKSFCLHMAGTPASSGLGKAATEPKKFEARTEFIKRLRCAVAWVTRHRSAYLSNLCNSQKAFAKDVLAVAGARTKH